MARRGETVNYTSPSIEEVYQRKLEALCARIKDLVYSGLVYVVSQEYCCKFCKCRILVRQAECVYCIRCQSVPFWGASTRESVVQLMEQYPTLQECQTQQRPPEPRDIPPEAVAFGARVEEERLARGWSQEYLASQIIKPNGERLAKSTIGLIETGRNNPSRHVKEQLERLLGLRERIAV